MAWHGARQHLARLSFTLWHTAKEYVARMRVQTGPRPDFLTPRALCAAGLAAMVALGAILDFGALHDEALVPLFAIDTWCDHVFWRTMSGFGLAGFWFALLAGVAVALALCPFSAGHTLERKRLRLGRFVLIERLLFVGLVLATGGIVVQMLKHAVGRARPALMGQVGAFHFDVFSLKASLASFPSGHAVTAFSLLFCVFALAGQSAQKPSFFGFWAYYSLRFCACVLALLVALSRLMLQAHYVSDVVAGATLGVAVGFFLAYECACHRLCFGVRGGALVMRGRRCAGAVLVSLKSFSWL